MGIWVSLGVVVLAWLACAAIELAAMLLVRLLLKKAAWTRKNQNVRGYLEAVSEGSNQDLLFRAGVQSAVWTIPMSLVFL